MTSKAYRTGYADAQQVLREFEAPLSRAQLVGLLSTEGYEASEQLIVGLSDNELARALGLGLTEVRDGPHYSAATFAVLRDYDRGWNAAITEAAADEEG